jgi:DNA replication and repair protein RecF
VHRDNYEFVFNKTEADGSASRGEVRSIILAMKFIEAQLIYEKTGKKPIVLLDDVFSELDEMRQKALTRNFKDNQVIITSTDVTE